MRLTKKDAQTTGETVKAETREVEALSRALAQARAGYADLPVYIEADRESRFEAYVKALEALESVELRRVAIITGKAQK